MSHGPAHWSQSSPPRWALRPPPVGELVALLVNAPPYGLSVRTVPGLFQVHPVVPTPSVAHSSWAREREGDRERVRQRVGTGRQRKGEREREGGR